MLRSLRLPAINKKSAIQLRIADFCVEASLPIPCFIPMQRRGIHNTHCGNNGFFDSLRSLRMTIFLSFLCRGRVSRPAGGETPPLHRRAFFTALRSLRMTIFLSFLCRGRVSRPAGGETPPLHRRAFFTALRSSAFVGAIHESPIAECSSRAHRDATLQ